MPHCIVILPNSNGMQLLLCYNNEGVYVSTYGKATKNVFLQWGETPSSVGNSLIYLIHLSNSSFFTFYIQMRTSKHVHFLIKVLSTTVEQHNNFFLASVTFFLAFL